MGHLSRCGPLSNTIHALDHLQTKLNPAVRCSSTPFTSGTVRVFHWLTDWHIQFYLPPKDIRFIAPVFLCVNVSVQHFCITNILINYPDRLISTLGSNNDAVDSKNREMSLLRLRKQPRGSWRLKWWRWVNFPLVLIHTATLLTHFASWKDNANSSSTNAELRLFFVNY
jgi:hypothetical protein